MPKQAKPKGKRGVLMHKRKPPRNIMDRSRFKKPNPKGAPIDLSAVQRKPLNMKGINVVLEKARKGEGKVTPPFFSDANRAWRVEWEIPDHQYPGSVWRSSFFCSELVHAQALQSEAIKCKTREQWEAVRNKARKLAVQRGEFLLYRVMPGRREIFRGREVTGPGGQYFIEAVEG